MTDRPLHEDFGEKIGGAKKDLWRARGLYADDLDEMNGREADKYVTKDNVWKKPNYQDLHDDGVPVDVVYFIKKVRDSLNVRPAIYRNYSQDERKTIQKRYITTVRQLQAVMENVRSVDDAKKAFDKFFVDNGYLQKANGSIIGASYIPASEYYRNPALSQKLISTLQIRSDRQFERDFTLKAERDQFLVPKDQKIPRGYEVKHYSGNGYVQHKDWKSDTYYVVRKGYTIVADNFATREEAIRWAQELEKSKTRSGKRRFVPPQLEHITRTGPDYRNGQDIVGQNYLDTFGFRGGEFGNWLNQLDRQASLNMGFEALKDLATALHISDKDIAFASTLAIAFGARGSGNAAAHYEPLRKVINLTKMHGAGSLAHEWWHGLDDYLGGLKGANGMLSEHPNLYEPMKKLVDAIKFKSETLDQAKERIEKSNARQRKSAEAWVDSVMKSTVYHTDDPIIIERYEALKADFLKGEHDTVFKLSSLKKEITGHVIPKSTCQDLEVQEYIMRGIQNQGEPKLQRIQTDYFKNSKKMGSETEKDGGYWDSEVEMAARAFACYIKDRLPYQSDYLVGHAESCVGLYTNKDGSTEVIRAYPQGEERKAINAAFDDLIAELKKELIFTHTEEVHSLPLPKEQAPQQLSLLGEEKPSVLGQLAAAKIAQKPPVPHKKDHEQSL
nr:LPD1 domain-containing protein [uncultured Ruminococcus sp.]